MVLLKLSISLERLKPGALGRCHISDLKFLVLQDFSVLLYTSNIWWLMPASNTRVQDVKQMRSLLYLHLRWRKDTHAVLVPLLFYPYHLHTHEIHYFIFCNGIQ